VTFLDYKKKRLPCACDKEELKIASREYFRTYNGSIKKIYHCCRCKKPTTTNELFRGAEHHQVCSTCYDREQNLTITCVTCGTEVPDEDKENIGRNLDACSYVCKYAYLAVTSVRTFEAVPQRVYHYLNTGRGQYNVHLDEGEILNASEAYYIEQFGRPEPEQYFRSVDNKETWNEARARLSREAAEYLWDNVISYIEGNDSDDDDAEDYVRQLNESFEERRQRIIDALPRNLDLQTDTRFALSQMNLCYECLMPYPNEELRTVEELNNKLLCDDCHTEWVQRR